MSPLPGRSPGTLLLAALILVAIPVAAEVDVQAAKAPVNAADHEERLQAVRKRIQDLKALMRKKRGEQSELNRALETSESRIGRLARRLRVLLGRIDRQKQRLAELQRQQGDQQQRLASQREALAEQLRAAYIMGRQERVKLLLNQEDPARVNRALTYYDYLNRERAARVVAIRRRLEDLRVTEEEIARQDQRLKGMYAKVATERAQLQQTQNSRRGVLNALAQELRSQDEEMARLLEDEREFKTLLEGIEKALQDIPTGELQEEQFANLRGRLPWPSAGTLSARFGAHKIGALRWDGVMISAPEGGDVRAVHHGRVAYADWLRGFGLLLIIDHGDGWMTLYGHNQSLFKEAGDWVEADEPVALVGSSGGRENPGVYFGIRHKGKPVDPLRWCERPRGRKVG